MRLRLGGEITRRRNIPSSASVASSGWRRFLQRASSGQSRRKRQPSPSRQRVVKCVELYKKTPETTDDQAKLICKCLDDQDVPVPENWQDVSTLPNTWMKESCPASTWVDALKYGGKSFVMTNILQRCRNAKSKT